MMISTCLIFKTLANILTAAQGLPVEVEKQVIYPDELGNFRLPKLLPLCDASFIPAAVMCFFRGIKLRDFYRFDEDEFLVAKCHTFMSCACEAPWLPCGVTELEGY